MLIFFCMLFFSFLSLFFVCASDIRESAESMARDPLGVGVDPVKLADKKPEDLVSDSSSYLKQEWIKFIEKDEFGKYIVGFSNFLKTLNPLFKIILGVDYSLSWAFVFAVIIWLTLFFFLLKPTEAIFGNPFFGFIGAFAISSLVGLAGVIKKVVDMLTFMITNAWIAWVALAVTIFISIIFEKLGGNFKKAIEEMKEKQAKQRTAQDREIIHADAEVSKKNLESYRDAGEGI